MQKKNLSLFTIAHSIQQDKKYKLKELNEGTIIEERKDENKQQIRKQVCMEMMLTKNFCNY